jgi:pyrroline-5-carboxylate reductase
MQLERRLYSYLAICGHLNENFNFMIKEANTAINTNAPDAQQKVDVLLAAVKPAFI